MNAILILALVVTGQCGPRGCPAPARAVINYTESATVRPAQVEGRDYYVVRTYRVNHDGLTFEVKGYMHGNGRVVWEPSNPFNAESWAAAKKAPTRRPVVRPVPAKGESAVDTVTRPFKGLPFEQIKNFGMEPGRMGSKESYTGTSPEAQRFIQEAKEGSTPDRLHVTVIGTDDERAQVVNDLKTHPAFAGLKSALMVQDYSPSEWPVDPSLGFVTTGKPTILVQTAKSAADPNGGKVVLRASDYKMGPEALAEEIRKANPSYKPSSDPVPSGGKDKPGLGVCPLGFNRDHWPYILIVGIGLALFSKLPRKGV